MNYPKNQPKPKPATAAPSKQQNGTITHTQLQVEHHGPIPDPNTLQKYNQIQPDFAERIMCMAENEQRRRHLNDETVLKNQHDQHKRDTDTMRIGQTFALIASGSIVGLCVYFVNLGYANQAASIACAVIVGLAGVFMYSKKSSNKSD